MVEGSFTSLVPFDIDTQDNEGVDLDAVFDSRICMTPEVALCFKSPSNGLKGLVAVQMHFDVDTFAETIKNNLYPKLEKKWLMQIQYSLWRFQKLLRHYCQLHQLWCLRPNV